VLDRTVECLHPAVRESFGDYSYPAARATVRRNTASSTVRGLATSLLRRQSVRPVLDLLYLSLSFAARRSRSSCRSRRDTRGGAAMFQERGAFLSSRRWRSLPSRALVCVLHRSARCSPLRRSARPRSSCALDHYVRVRSRGPTRSVPRGLVQSDGRRDPGAGSACPRVRSNAATSFALR